MYNGGYDDGYAVCNCFWGKEPAEFVKKAAKLLGKYKNKKAFYLSWWICEKGLVVCKSSIWLLF